MKNIFKILFVAVLVLGSVSFLKVKAVHTNFNCHIPNAAGICTSLSDDLPDGPVGGINPNTKINLSFSVYQESNAQPPVCASGKQLFHAVRHNINGQADIWDYYAAGTGQDIEYTFNSGQYGQRNRYSGVFYCWNKTVVETDKTQYSSNRSFVIAKKYLADPVGSLPVGQFWITPELNLQTRNDPNPKLPVEKKTEVQTTTTEKKTSLNFPNPLQSENLNDLIGTIMHWLRVIALPIAVIIIVISGIIMMYSRGDSGKFDQGKKILIWAVVGLAVILIGEGFTKLIESIIELKNR